MLRSKTKGKEIGRENTGSFFDKGFRNFRKVGGRQRLIESLVKAWPGGPLGFCLRARENKFPAEIFARCHPAVIFMRGARRWNGKWMTRIRFHVGNATGFSRRCLRAVSKPTSSPRYALLYIFLFFFFSFCFHLLGPLFFSLLLLKHDVLLRAPK